MIHALMTFLLGFLTGGIVVAILFSMAATDDLSGVPPRSMDEWQGYEPEEAR